MDMVPYDIPVSTFSYFTQRIKDSLLVENVDTVFLTLTPEQDFYGMGRQFADMVRVNLEKAIAIDRNRVTGTRKRVINFYNIYQDTKDGLSDMNFHIKATEVYTR